MRDIKAHISGERVAQIGMLMSVSTIFRISCLESSLNNEKQNILWHLQTPKALAQIRRCNLNKTFFCKRKKGSWSSFDYVSEIKSNNYGNCGKMVIQRLPLASKLAQQMEH